MLATKTKKKVTKKRITPIAKLINKVDVIVAENIIEQSKILKSFLALDKKLEAIIHHQKEGLKA